MKRLVIAVSSILLLLTGIASAQQPQITYGTGWGTVHLDAGDYCQYGFQDDAHGWGYGLNGTAQLGIQCTGPMTIASVGFYVEFCEPGSLDIVIYDDGIEVSRTPVSPAQGINDFDINDVGITGTACVMLCPTSFNGVTGEDMTNPPFGHTYYSSNCTCLHEFTDLNLMIWLGSNPRGACCHPDGSCTITAQGECTGNWLGAGTVCIQPSIVGTADTPGQAVRVAVAGTYAYVGDNRSGLQVIDVSNPLSPQVVGSVDTPGYAYGVAPAGTYAYLADHIAGLQVIDVSNPGSPRIVSTVDTPGEALRVVLAGAYAYVADGSSGLQVINISQPQSPQIVGSVDTPGHAYGVALAGIYVFVADYESGLQVIDVSNPGSPHIVGSVDTPGYAWSVAVGGTYAYIADESYGLQVIDISNPGSPIIVGTADTPSHAYDVAMAGTKAYVADDQSGLEVIDVSNPGSPHIMGRVDTPGFAYGVAVTATYAYVADFERGLQIIAPGDRCEPTSGLADHALGGRPVALFAAPNPAHGGTTVHLGPGRDGPAALDIYDSGGRVIRRLFEGRMTAGEHALPWDERDDLGRSVPAGAYWLRLSTAEGRVDGRLIIVR